MSVSFVSALNFQTTCQDWIVPAIICSLMMALLYFISVIFVIVTFFKFRIVCCFYFITVINVLILFLYRFYCRAPPFIFRVRRSTNSLDWLIAVDNFLIMISNNCVCVCSLVRGICRLCECGQTVQGSSETVTRVARLREQNCCQQERRLRRLRVTKFPTIKLAFWSPMQLHGSWQTWQPLWACRRASNCCRWLLGDDRSLDHHELRSSVGPLLNPLPQNGVSVRRAAFVQFHLDHRPHSTTPAALFQQRLPRSACGSPLHCWQPSIFGCRSSGVELPATGGYVGTISVNLPHSTQDVPVYWIISRHSAYLTFCVYTLVDLAVF